jgi:hypothetical protein
MGSLLESYDLGMIEVGVLMSAFPDDFGFAVGTGLGEDAAYLGVRRGQADGLGGEI